ncbi:MAG: hypothetical protein R2705_20960 [Ilumatobacteraceae bacterium]
MLYGPLSTAVGHDLDAFDRGMVEGQVQRLSVTTRCCSRSFASSAGELALSVQRAGRAAPPLSRRVLAVARRRPGAS